jgi:hypothetical protein
MLHLNLSSNFLKLAAMWNLDHINELLTVFYIKIHWYILYFKWFFYT